MPSTIDSFWDLAYDNGDYLEHWESPQTPAELVALVASGFVPSGARVLDLGCGAGSDAIFLARQGFRVIGVDSSQTAIDIALARSLEAGVDVELFHADVADLPLPDQSIDFACDRGCFHVIDRDQRSRYAGELFRILRPGARFLLRGAAVDDDEEGVFAVDSTEIDRFFGGERFSYGAVVPIALVARSGTLSGNLAVLVRR